MYPDCRLALSKKWLEKQIIHRTNLFEIRPSVLNAVYTELVFLMETDMNNYSKADILKALQISIDMIISCSDMEQHHDATKNPS